MDYMKIRDLSGRNGGQNNGANRERLKRVRPMEVEQRHIIKFLHLKGLKLGDIALDLSSLYGGDAYSRSSIEYWLHQLRLGRKYLMTQRVSGRPPVDDTDTDYSIGLSDISVLFGANNG
jgi:hypothetical protein